MARRPKLILFASAAVALVGTACQLPPFLPEFQISTSDPGYNSAEDVAMSDQGDSRPCQIPKMNPGVSEYVYDRSTNALL